MRWQWIGGRHFHRLVKTRGSGWASGWWSSRLGPTFTNDRIKGRSFGHFDVLFVKILQERQRWPVFIVKMPIRFVLVGREGGSRGGWSCHFLSSFPNFLTAFLVGDPSLSKFPACLGLRESQLRACMTGTRSSLELKIILFPHCLKLSFYFSQLNCIFSENYLILIENCQGLIKVWNSEK